MGMDDTLQAICRDYLSRLRDVAKRHGLGMWVDDMIGKNAMGECKGTMEEVEMLSRIVDDERLARKDIPKLFGTSYRKCESMGYFDKIKTLKRVGIYSKVSALLFKEL